jgi:RNA polymerase sigma-70 factor, ECF subfamily
VSEPFEALLRIEGGRVLATLIRLTGDIGLAEDALQDAIVTAIEKWPVTGMPRNPAAWLTTTARNRALDRLRRDSHRPRNEQRAVMFEAHLDDERPNSDHAGAVRDDQLRLLFTCCHPSLAPEARVALALRTICGLSTAEIARVHLVPEATMGQRLSRAKRKISAARIPYRVPSDHELPDRLPTVLTTVYAVFTVGHHAPSGRLDSRVDVADEGVRLARLLTDLMPDEPECKGLLALVLATHARRDTRLDEFGDLVLLDRQDRQRWHHAEIAEAAAIIENVLPFRRIGPYQLQAAISCLHSTAATIEATDWNQIATLYAHLENCSPSPVVRVNRAVAVAYASTPQHGLALLDTLNGPLIDRWHLYWSTRAELHLRSGHIDQAQHCFERALACEMNDTDRRFLERRAATT